MPRRRRAPDVALLHRYRLSDLTFESDQPVPELQPAAGSAEVRVLWRHAPASPMAAVPFSSWKTAEGSDWLTFTDYAGGFLLTFPEHGQFEVSRDGSIVTVLPFPATPPETMRHLLLNQILPLVLSRRGRFVLHASAVSYRDQVMAFIGRSGGGKSTLAVACAIAGAAIVSDDCLVVNRCGAGWSVVPCHAGIRLWPSALALFGWEANAGDAAAHYSDKRRFDDRHHQLAFETRELPLSAIVYLPSISSGESPSDALGPLATSQMLGGRDAVMALVSEVFRLDSRDPAESRRQFEVVGQLAVDIPVEVLTRRAPDVAAQALLCRMSDRRRRPRD